MGYFYRVTLHLDSYILLQWIRGVPPTCGPLLQLATAQAGQGNSPKWFQMNIGLKVTGHPVHTTGIWPRLKGILYLCMVWNILSSIPVANSCFGSISWLGNTTVSSPGFGCSSNMCSLNSSCWREIVIWDISGQFTWKWAFWSDPARIKLDKDLIYSYH